MFLTLALFSTLGYAVQTFLMASYYRRFDALATSSVRGLSLGITMLPLLYFSGPGGLIATLNFWPILLGAAFASVFGNWSAGISYRCLPVGIATAIQQGFALITVSILGIIFFKEVPGGTTLLGICVILLGNTILTLSKGHATTDGQLFTRMPLKGLLYCGVYAITIACSATAVSYISRNSDPMFAGYLWEVLIGVFSLFILALRKKVCAVSSISKKDILGILVCASPTAVGTGCYLLAVTMGPIALLSAIVSNTVILVTIFAFFFYREKLSVGEVVAIVLIVASIIYLKISGATG